MLISVIYKNGKLGLIKATSINELINKKKINGFLRLDGWVNVTNDLIRGKGGRHNGTERRISFRFPVEY